MKTYYKALCIALLSLLSSLVYADTFINPVLVNPNVIGGTGKFTSLPVPAGSPSANSISFGGSPTTGFYSPSAGTVATPSNFTAGGSLSATAGFTNSNFNNLGIGGFVLTTKYYLGPSLLAQATAPVWGSGFGTAPVVIANNTAAFAVNVGTGGTASSGVITMPAAATGWACTAASTNTPQAAAVIVVASTSATSITIANYTLATGVPLAWPASFTMNVMCTGR